MERQLVLEDNHGEVVRAYAWDGEPVSVVRRGDTLRLELVSSIESLKDKHIPFELLGSFDESHIKTGFPVGALGALRVLPKIEVVSNDDRQTEEKSTLWWISLGTTLLLAGGLISVLVGHPPSLTSNEESLKQEVIKIVKHIPPRQKAAPNSFAQQGYETKADNNQPKSADRLKRMGALGALGSLSKSKQFGGLNLGAANTTAGPGLGGTAGSGGVQTSLYAKGLTSAPLGAGGNVQGAGGYGTKGKGGGQAGYGKMTLVGSTGATPVGLSQEATVATGLDRDQIAAVINRNLGQVRFCYEQGLQGDPNLNGRVAVDFVIGGKGAVTAANVASSSLNSKAIEDCIVLRLKSWKFPLPQGGVDVKVSYPFVLRRTGQG